VLVGIAAAVAAAGLLTLASWATTQEDWDGGFPAGVVRLEVRAADGRPVPGAAFRVYNQATGQPSPGYPFLDPAGPTDAGGRLTVVQPHSGLQFGGHRWRLFWAVRMGDTAPRYECEVAAAGFRPVRIDLFDLFGSARRTEDQVKVHWPAREREVELVVYEAAIVLEQ
jgi:hypothetical protein